MLFPAIGVRLAGPGRRVRPAVAAEFIRLAPRLVERPICALALEGTSSSLHLRLDHAVHSHLRRGRLGEGETTFRADGFGFPPDRS